MLLQLIAALFSVSAFAAQTTIPVEFEIHDVMGACKTHSCQLDEATNTQKCRYKIFFDDASFAGINQIRQDRGLNMTWFEKNPREICEAGELPMSGEGFAALRVMLYKMDRSVLSREF